MLFTSAFTPPVLVATCCFRTRDVLGEDASYAVIDVF